MNIVVVLEAVLVSLALAIMAPKSFTGSPIPEPSLEALVAKERARIAAWQASLPMPGTSIRGPGIAASMMGGRPHPMGSRMPMPLTSPSTSPAPHCMSVRPPSLTVNYSCPVAPSSSQSASPPSSHILPVRPTPTTLQIRDDPLTSTSASSSTALAIGPEAKLKSSLKRAVPPINYNARGDKKRGLEIARDAMKLDEAVVKYKKEIRSVNDTSDHYIKTWHDFRHAVC